MLLRLAPNRTHHLIPFVIGKRGCILPCFHLTRKARIGPQMVAVRCEVQPVGIRRQGAGKEMLIGQNNLSVRPEPVEGRKQMG
jgi:hypothetical protein